MTYTRIILAAALITGFSLSVNAQKAVEKTTDATCKCLEDKKASKMNVEEAKQALQVCMMEAMMPRLEDLMKELKLKEFNENAGYKIGLEIGKKLAVTCPEFLAVSVKMAEDKNPALRDDYEPSGEEGNSFKGASPEMRTEGKLVRVESNEFSSFVVTGSDGRETKYYWLTYFPGSEKLETDPSKYVGQNLKIGYREVEVYVPKAKGYYKIKEITSLEPVE